MLVPTRGGGAKDPTPRRARRGLRAGSRGGTRARSRRAARAAVAGARGARDGRARGFVRVGGGLGAAAATRMISSRRRAPFWIEKPSRDPRKARGCGGASRRAGFRERASRARRDARGRTSGWAFARTTVRTRRARPPRAKAERAGTRTPPLVKPEPRLAALLAGAATGAMPATAETAWLAMVRRCENRREGLRGKCVTPGRSSRRGALRSTVSSKCARRCTRARARSRRFSTEEIHSHTPSPATGERTLRRSAMVWRPARCGRNRPSIDRRRRSVRRSPGSDSGSRIEGSGSASVIGSAGRVFANAMRSVTAEAFTLGR